MDLYILGEGGEITHLYDRKSSVCYEVHTQWSWKNPTLTSITRVNSRGNGPSDEGVTIAEIEWSSLQPSLVHINGDAKGVEIQHYLRGKRK